MPFSAQFTRQKKEALAKSCIFPLVELYYRHAVEMGMTARLGLKPCLMEDYQAIFGVEMGMTARLGLKQHLVLFLPCVGLWSKWG